MEQVNFRTTTQLVEAMLKEVTTLRNDLQAIVRQTYPLSTIIHTLLHRTSPLQIKKGQWTKGLRSPMALDTALASFAVERQAYYSGTSVVNYVHKCLKVHTA